jgi:hypothetical protein
MIAAQAPTSAASISIGRTVLTKSRFLKSREYDAIAFAFTLPDIQLIIKGATAVNNQNICGSTNSILFHHSDPFLKVLKFFGVGCNNLLLPSYCFSIFLILTS